MGSWGWTVLGLRHVETVTMETCNVLVLGDQGAGKSCLINRFLTGQFIHNQFHSVNGSSTHQKLHFIHDTRVKFIISESSDINDPRVTDPSTDVILICFPLDSSVHLASVVSHWSRLTSTVTSLLVGTMADVREDLLASTTYQQAASVARQIGAVTYIETSSKLSYTSTSAAFEAAAQAVLPQVSRQPPASLISTSARNSTKYRRENSSGTKSDTMNKISTLDKHAGGGALSSAKKKFSLSNGSLHSKSSTLSSNKSTSSVLSISTGKTPILGRRNKKVPEEVERMVTIKVERLTKDKQVEEVEIEIPVSVYNNMQNNEESDFVRNSGRRKSLACKLKNLILR